MGWQKEKREHPWTTKAQAKRIAHDHAAKIKTKKAPTHPSSFNPVNVAATDVSLYLAKSKKIAYQRKP